MTMKEELVNNIDFTQEEYEEIAQGEGISSFDKFIENVVSIVKEHNGTLEDAIFIANDAFSKFEKE